MFVISGPPDVPTGPSARAAIGAAPLSASAITANEPNFVWVITNALRPAKNIFRHFTP